MTRLARVLTSAAARVMGVWVKPEAQSEQNIEAIRALAADPSARICYVLETGGSADRLALERLCERLVLPSPSADLHYADHRENKSVMVLRRKQGFFVRRTAHFHSKRLARVVEAGVRAREAEAATVDALPMYLIPVGIYWGRAPGKERSWFTLLFSEDWEVAGRLRKFLTTLLHGRHTLAQFSEPMQIAPVLAEGMSSERTMRKIARVLRVHFRRRRAATVGPDLSHRRTLINDIIRAPAVREIIADQAKGDVRERRKARKKARSYAVEIAADLSYPTVRSLERFLGWLWTRIYDGIQLNGIEDLRELAEGNELIYVPCHRSHFDYLLLSYVLFRQGLSLPYVAAGINLNLPVVGSILRRGGAFFLRRTFSGNRLYAAVFNAYLKEVQSRGYPIEYFIEGGRSRTGRLLEPKGGMLSMTVQAFLQDPRRPVKFVPVYFGYERLIEGGAYVGELRGGEKKKETLGGLIRSLKSLREQFGQVYVNVGEPIDLAEVLDAHSETWREEKLTDQDKPKWLAPVVDDLGDEILERINAAAAVTPISLLSLALLGTPRHWLAKDDLARQLDLYCELLKRTPYSAHMTLPDMNGEQMIAHGVKLNVISIEAHPLGELVQLKEKEAVLLTYFRNNILHLPAIHSLVAACYIHGRQIRQDELQRLVALTFPYVKAELRLVFEQEDIDDVVLAVIQSMESLGLLERTGDGSSLKRPQAGSEKAFQLIQLGQSMVPLLQRYYMTIALMNRYGAGVLTQARLERICQLCAERLSIIYGMRSPDFFDRHLFRNFLRTLRDAGALTINAEGRLTYDTRLANIEADARLVLGEPLRHSILTVTDLLIPEPDEAKQSKKA